MSWFQDIKEDTAQKQQTTNNKQQQQQQQTLADLASSIKMVKSGARRYIFDAQHFR